MNKILFICSGSINCDDDECNHKYPHEIICDICRKDKETCNCLDSDRQFCDEKEYCYDGDDYVHCIKSIELEDFITKEEILF